MPSLPVSRLHLLAVVLLLAGCARQESPLTRKIDTVVGRPLYKNARWGILVCEILQQACR